MTRKRLWLRLKPRGNCALVVALINHILTDAKSVHESDFAFPIFRCHNCSFVVLWFVGSVFAAPFIALFTFLTAVKYCLTSVLKIAELLG